MKQSFSILALGLVLASSACGGSPAPDSAPVLSSSSVAPAAQPTTSEAPSESDAAYAECAQEWAQGIADLKGGEAADYLDDPDVKAVCEGFRAFDEAVESLPAYTPAPAAEVDPTCLRAWAENNMDMFEGMTVEEAMEDPMARFSCE